MTSTRADVSYCSIVRYCSRGMPGMYYIIARHTPPDSLSAYRFVVRLRDITLEPF